jgi:hypothetical protein
MNFLLARLLEPSSLYGLLNCATAFGILNVTESQSSALSFAITCLFGLGAASIVTPDKRG